MDPATEQRVRALYERMNHPAFQLSEQNREHLTLLGSSVTAALVYLNAMPPPYEYSTVRITAGEWRYSVYFEHGAWRFKWLKYDADSGTMAWTSSTDEGHMRGDHVHYPARALKFWSVEQLLGDRENGGDVVFNVERLLDTATVTSTNTVAELRFTYDDEQHYAAITFTSADTWEETEQLLLNDQLVALMWNDHVFSTER